MSPLRISLRSCLLHQKNCVSLLHSLSSWTLYLLQKFIGSFLPFVPSAHTHIYPHTTTQPHTTTHNHTQPHTTTHNHTTTRNSPQRRSQQAMVDFYTEKSLLHAKELSSLRKWLWCICPPDAFQSLSVDAAGIPSKKVVANALKKERAEEKSMSATKSQQHQQQHQHQHQHQQHQHQHNTNKSNHKQANWFQVIQFGTPPSKQAYFERINFVPQPAKLCCHCCLSLSLSLSLLMSAHSCEPVLLLAEFEQTFLSQLKVSLLFDSVMCVWSYKVCMIVRVLFCC